MSEHIRKSDDPNTPHQRIRVVDELDDWGMVSIHDEDVTSSRTAAQSLARTTVRLLAGEARWLRDVLNGLDLGHESET